MNLIPDPYDPHAFGVAVLLLLAGLTVESVRFLRSTDTADEILHSVKLNNVSFVVIVLGSLTAAAAEHYATAIVFWIIACASNLTASALRRDAARLRAAERQAAIDTAKQLDLPFPEAGQ